MCIPSIADPCSILETGSIEWLVYKYVHWCVQYCQSNVKVYQNVLTVRNLTLKYISLYIQICASVCACTEAKFNGAGYLVAAFPAYSSYFT